MQCLKLPELNTLARRTATDTDLRKVLARHFEMNILPEGCFEDLGKWTGPLSHSRGIDEMKREHNPVLIERPPAGAIDGVAQAEYKLMHRVTD